jgi:hypothetical protein
MTRFVVLLLFFFATVILTSEAQEHHLEEDWQNSVEASELQPEKVAARKMIPGATWEIRPFAAWNSHWKFQRCPPGMKRVNSGKCRQVWNRAPEGKYEYLFWCYSVKSL